MYYVNMKIIHVEVIILEHKEMQFTLKELRARKNETQMQTAEALGVSVQTYNAWEKDISNVAVSKVNAVARHFGVTLSQIFLGTT